MITLPRAAVSLSLVLSGLSASAQSVPCAPGAGFPCANQLVGVSLTRVPTAFRIEARVAQAKLPIAQAVFENVVVKVLRGSETICNGCGTVIMHRALGGFWHARLGQTIGLEASWNVLGAGSSHGGRQSV